MNCSFNTHYSNNYRQRHSTVGLHANSNIIHLLIYRTSITSLKTKVCGTKQHVLTVTLYSTTSNMLNIIWQHRLTETHGVK